METFIFSETCYKQMCSADAICRLFSWFVFILSTIPSASDRRKVVLVGCFKSFWPLQTWQNPVSAPFRSTVRTNSWESPLGLRIENCFVRLINGMKCCCVWRWLQQRGGGGVSHLHRTSISRGSGLPPLSPAYVALQSTWLATVLLWLPCILPFVQGAQA